MPLITVLIGYNRIVPELVTVSHNWHKFDIIVCHFWLKLECANLGKCIIYAISNYQLSQKWHNSCTLPYRVTSYQLSQKWHNSHALPL